VFLHDVPGLMIGTQAERGCILRAYEAVVSRIATALVPKVGVVLRKAYGGGHFAMGGRPTHPDFLFAWPSAELGFMAPEAGVRTVHRRRMEAVLAEQGPGRAGRPGRRADRGLDGRIRAVGGGRAPVRGRRDRAGRHPRRHRPRPGAGVGQPG
jgi:Acetyl-CoA carboxylase, carboxyltransferase component (subunits alpha and beta)